MKRLLSKIKNKLIYNFKKNRIIMSSWVHYDIEKEETIRLITESISKGYKIRIWYHGNWRVVSPYGWKTSKFGNVMIMCYKENGEIRSYSLNNIMEIEFNEDLLYE